MDDEQRSEPIHIGRSLTGPVISWLVIAAAIYAVMKISWWFYPLALLVIANRQLALVLYGHEGLHGTLLPNSRANDFVARYFLLFPNWVSLSRYRMKHFLHHRFVGTKLDPDLGLYSGYPFATRQWAALAGRYFSGRMAQDFLDYYTDLPRLLKGDPSLQRKGSVFGASDWPQFVIFQVFVLTAAAVSGYGREYLLFWAAPSMLFLPYNYFIGGLQHGVVVSDESPRKRSRTIHGPKWLMEILLPADINFHAAHHLYPRIPHYHLRRIDRELKVETVRQSYAATLKGLRKNS